MKPTIQTISGIETLSVKKTKAKAAIIMMHGYGASMNDLFPLWEMWDRPDCDWFFPNGIQSLPMGYYEGRAWFSVDIEALDRAIRTGAPRDMANTLPPEFDETMNRLTQFIQELAPQYEQVIIGGFSQGAMCASHLALNSSLKISGLILLSGSLIAKVKMPSEGNPIPFFQSHGTKDPILPLAGARELYECLRQMKLQGELHVFEGGHEIPMSVISGVREFLENLRF